MVILNHKNEIANVQLLKVECKQLKQEDSSDESNESKSDWKSDKPIFGLFDDENDFVTGKGKYCECIHCIAPVTFDGDDS